jgi:hypothetical protein
MATSQLSQNDLERLLREQLECVDYYIPLYKDACKRRHAVDADYYSRHLIAAKRAVRAITAIIKHLWVTPIEQDEKLEARQIQVVKMSHRFTQVMLASK